MNLKSISDKKYNEYIKKALDEADKEAEDTNTKFLTHEEVFQKLRNEINKSKKN